MECHPREIEVVAVPVAIRATRKAAAEVRRRSLTSRQADHLRRHLRPLLQLHRPSQADLRIITIITTATIPALISTITTIILRTTTCTTPTMLVQLPPHPTRAGPMGTTTTAVAITMATQPTTTIAATITASRITPMTLIAVMRRPNMDRNESGPKLPPVGSVALTVLTLAIHGTTPVFSTARLHTNWRDFFQKGQFIEFNFPARTFFFGQPIQKRT